MNWDSFVRPLKSCGQPLRTISLKCGGKLKNEKHSTPLLLTICVPSDGTKGYNEMLQTGDEFPNEGNRRHNGKAYISRMENYVSSMSNLRRMEDTQPEYKLIDLQPLVSSLYDSAKIVCAKMQKS